MKSNNKSKSNNLNIFNRILAIWKPNFLNYLISEKSPAPTWKFWFLWNSIFSILITIVVFILGQNFITNLEKEWWPQVPDFEITLKDNLLSTNLNEPIVWTEGDFIFVLDTKEKEYDKSIIEEYNNVVFINSEEIIIKDHDKYRTTQFPFNEIEEDFMFTKFDAKDLYDKIKNTIKLYIIIFLGIIIWFSLAIYRLFSAIWWTLLAWGTGSILKIKNWNFGTAYLLILNLYFIPLLIDILLMLNLFLFPIPYIPFLTFLTFAILVGLNFHHTLSRKK